MMKPAACLLAALLLASCTATSPDRAQAPTPSVETPGAAAATDAHQSATATQILTSIDLTPPSAPMFATPSESTTSHHDAWMAGTDSTHFIYLAATDGLVGYTPTPMLFSRVGARIYLQTSGTPGATVTAQPAGIVQIRGLTLLAIGPGTATLSTHADCAAVSGTGSANGPGGQPPACTLMEIIVK